VPTLRERLGHGAPVYSGWSAIPDSLAVEALAGTAFDAVTLDMLHGGHHEDSVLRALGAIIAEGKHALVRIPVGRFDMASRALDFGADAVIAPMINSVADAKAFAQACKYPPVGGRSWGPSFAMPRRGVKSSGDWLAGGNASTLAFAMIETREALAVVDDILAVHGIDGVLVGPADFSIAWSNGRLVDPSHEPMMEAIADIAARASGAGKLAAIYVSDPALIPRFVDMGFRMVALGSEARLMQIGADALIKAAKGG
jgi:4-hydroxy-2-oxoheptanedioate aldolase